MKSLKHGILICLLFASIGVAQAPSPTPSPSVEVAKVVLKAPTTVEVGELVILDASESVACQYKWHIAPETKDFLVIDNGQRMAFSARKGRQYTFTVAVAFKDTVDVHVFTINVKGGTPPGPGVDLSSKVTEWCALIKSPDPKAEAARLAQSFESVASFTEADVLKTPADVVAATKKANNDALGTAQSAWTPFFEQLKIEIVAMAEAGKLQDAKSHAAVWYSIAEGLRTFSTSEG